MSCWHHWKSQQSGTLHRAGVQSPFIPFRIISADENQVVGFASESWRLVFNKISRYISGKQKSTKCRPNIDISFILTSGALPYFLCLSWEVQVRHKCNSLALTEIHHLPAQHLTWTSVNKTLSLVVRQCMYFVFDTILLVIFIFSSKFKNILSDSQSVKERNIWGWAICCSSDWEGVRALGHLNFFNCAWKGLERLWCQESRLYT